VPNHVCNGIIGNSVWVEWKAVVSRNGNKQINSLADLTSDPKNARKHTPRNVGTIVDALHEIGAARSIVIDEKGVVLAGNATMDAAIEAGLSKVQVVDGDGETIIAVRRSGLTAKQKTRLALYDNRAAELAEWDADVLQTLDVDELEGMFSDKELAEILSQTGVEPKDAEPQIDKAEELRQKWGTETGQLWEIGNHRLLVGDATNKADVGLVCADNKPSLMVTDPPYGVSYNAQWRQDAADKGHLAKARRAVGKVTNDDRSSWLPAFEECPADVCYVWHASASASAVQFAVDLMSAGFEIRNQIIWSKPAFAISRGHYNWQHEPCWYAVRKGKRSGWIGDHSESTIWEISNRNAEHTDHSTEKPLECMARPIRNHSGDVYDPFIGSGTTMVAAENLNRKCYAIEISPAYCAVTLERMTTAFPHLKIEKAEQAVAA
jgi:DNA modification methylase